MGRNRVTKERTEQVFFGWDVPEQPMNASQFADWTPDSCSPLSRNCTVSPARRPTTNMESDYIKRLVNSTLSSITCHFESGRNQSRPKNTAHDGAAALDGRDVIHQREGDVTLSGWSQMKSSILWNTFNALMMMKIMLYSIFQCSNTEHRSYYMKERMTLFSAGFFPRPGVFNLSHSPELQRLKCQSFPVKPGEKEWVVAFMSSCLFKSQGYVPSVHRTLLTGLGGILLFQFILSICTL